MGLGKIGKKIGGGLKKLKSKLSPKKMLEKLTKLPEKLSGITGMLGGAGGPLEMLKGMDPTGLLAGLTGAAQQRGLG